MSFKNKAGETMTVEDGIKALDEWFLLNREIAQALRERAAMRRTGTFDPLRDVELHTQQVELERKRAALYLRITRRSPMPTHDAMGRPMPDMPEIVEENEQ